MRSSLGRGSGLLHLLDDLINLFDSCCSLLGLRVAVTTDTDANADQENGDDGASSCRAHGSGVSDSTSTAEFGVEVEAHSTNVVDVVINDSAEEDTSEAGPLGGVEAADLLSAVLSANSSNLTGGSRERHVGIGSVSGVVALSDLRDAIIVFGRDDRLAGVERTDVGHEEGAGTGL